MKEVFKKGYTLVEVLIVVMIVSILSSIVILYGSTGRGIIALFTARSQFVQVLARARSLAVSTYSQGAATPCGYGVHVDYSAGTYAISSYDAPSCASITDLSAATITPTETFSLDPALVFGAGPSTLTDVVFYPPDPTTQVWVGPSTIVPSGQVYFATKDGVTTGRVAVTNAGQVSSY